MYFRVMSPPSDSNESGRVYRCVLQQQDGTEVTHTQRSTNDVPKLYVKSEYFVEADKHTHTLDLQSVCRGVQVTVQVFFCHLASTWEFV